jgi:hypothetical protein
MEFQEESVEITKEMIDKTINILLDMIPFISISKTVKSLLIGKMNYVFKCSLEKFKITFLQLAYIIWMITELNRKLPSIDYHKILPHILFYLTYMQASSFLTSICLMDVYQ